MKGIDQKRIDTVKRIPLQEYLLDTYPNKFRKRNNGDLVLKENKGLVVYNDHAYDFGEVKHPYKDSIYIEQLLSGCTFMEAVERLEEWIDKHDTPDKNNTPNEHKTTPTQDKENIDLHIFDNLDVPEYNDFLYDDTELPF